MKIKKTESEKRKDELKIQLKQTDAEIKASFEESVRFREKGDAYKAQQSTLRWATLIDKRKVIQDELDSIPAGEEDLVLKFENETAELFYQWLYKRDIGYHTYLMLIKKNPEVLQEILKHKGIDVEVDKLRKTIKGG